MEPNQQDGHQVEWEGGDQSSLQPDALAIQQLLNSDSMPNGIGPGEVMYVMVGTTTYQITGPEEAGGEVTIAPVTNLEELATIGAVTGEDGAAENQPQEGEVADVQAEPQTDQQEMQPEVVQADEQQQQEDSAEALQDDTIQHQPPQKQLTTQPGQEPQQEQTDANQQQQEMEHNLTEQQQEQLLQAQQQEQQQLLQKQQQQQLLQEHQQLLEQQQQQLLEQQQQQLLEQQQQQLLEQQQQQLLLEQQQNQQLQQQGLLKEQQQQEKQQTQETPQTQQQEGTQQVTEATLQQLTSNSGETAKLEGTTISLAGGDFVLQPGQQLPPEIQEMIAKGLPIDMSNFEFVVDDEQQPQQQAVTNNTAQTRNEIQYTTTEGEQLNVNGTEQTDDQPKNGIFVQVVTACPGEFDDGEFPQFPTILQEQRLNNSDPYITPKSFYLSQYIDFVTKEAKALVKDSHYNSSQQGRSILLNNQIQEKFKRKRLMDEDDEDLNWKINDPKRQRAKQQRMSVLSPNISKHSKGLNQHEMLKLHQASASNHLIFEMPVAFIMQNEPHNYQKGDFVVDKKDSYQSSFPMWRIESSKLLQKFEPIIENGIYLHKSASVYSSWSGDIRTNFRAVLADILSTSSAPIGRKQEIVVRVHNKYIPKPADEKLEQNALMQFFNIYVHVLLNQVFEPAYLTAIKQQNVEYYLEPMTQIDQLIAEAKQGVLLDCNWNSLFQVALETWSTYTFGPLKTADVRQQCQAVASGGHAVKVVKFYGQNYSADTLQADQDVSISSNRVVEFLVGRTAMANLGVYHALHHFKYLLFRRCHDEAVFQVSTQKKTSSDVPDICIQNRIWVQQMFQDLKGLLDRYIIIKTEEENAENSPQQ